MRWCAWWLLALAQGADLSESCSKQLEALVLDANLTFWSQRATKHCSLKFQNELQRCCSSGVIPLLNKQQLVNNSGYGGWSTLYRVPLEYKQKWTPSPTPVPTPLPTYARVAAPTPSPTTAMMGTVPDDSIISEVNTLPPSPVPTPFDNIRPPPMQDQIKILAAPAAPLLFAMESEGGVDLSGSGERPPVVGLKSCKADCAVDCTMLPRSQVCGKYFDGAQSCKLEHRPLPSFEIMNSLWTLSDGGASGRTAAMLSNLAQLTVTEDFCIPDACNNKNDLLAIPYAYFGQTREFAQEYMVIECDDGTMQTIAYAVASVLIILTLGSIFYVLVVPPKMPREYIVRRPDKSLG